MTAGLVIAICVFLLIDGLAVYWFVFRRPAKAGRRGEMALPGELSLQLPAGRVRLTYRAEMAPGELRIDRLPVPEELGIEVRDAGGGEPLPIERSRVPLQSRSLRKRTVQVQFGHVDVPSAGIYTVTADKEIAAEQPSLLIG